MYNLYFTVTSKSWHSYLNIVLYYNVEILTYYTNVQRIFNIRQFKENLLFFSTRKKKLIFI